MLRARDESHGARRMSCSRHESRSHRSASAARAALYPRSPHKWEIEQDQRERLSYAEQVARRVELLEAEMSRGAIAGHRYCDRCRGVGFLETEMHYIVGLSALAMCEVCLGGGREPIFPPAPEPDLAMGYDGTFRTRFCP